MAFDFSKGNKVKETTAKAPSSGFDFSSGASDTPAETPKRKWYGQILPTAGAILGGIGGGIAGAAAGAPEAGVGAIPLGYAGAVAGSAAGGALGESAQQGIEKIWGNRKSISPGDIAKTGAEFGVMEAIGGPVLSIAGKVAGKVAEPIYKAAFPTSAKEAALIQAYKAGTPFLERVSSAFGLKGAKAPITEADTAFSKGFMGTESMLGVQSKRAANNLWSHLIGPQLKNSEVKVSMPTFFKEAEEKIIKENPEKARQGDLLAALEAMKSDYKGVKEVTLEDLQKFKEGWAKFIPEKAWKGKPISGAFNDLKDTLSDMSREKIYSALGPEVKQAYIDYGNLKGIQELGQKAMTGGKLKGGFGGFWNAIKDIAVTPVTTVAGQTIYKVGKLAEFIGKPGASTVRDILLGASGTGKEINPTDAMPPDQLPETQPTQ